MKTVMNHFLSVALGASLGVTCCAAAENWGTDFEQGLAAAEKLDRSVLVEFTGSDWCSACAVLESKVLPTKVFTDFVAKNKLVPVVLDYPNAADKVSPEQRAKRNELSARYGITGFPTLLVVDSKGQPFGRIVGVIGSPEQHVERLQAILDVRKAYKKQVNAARKLTGVEKAKALEAALNVLPADCRPLHSALVDEIIGSDTDDVLGYRKARDTKSLQDKQLEEVKAALVQAVGDRKFIHAIDDARAAAAKLLEREDLLPFVRLSLNVYISQSYVMTNQLQEALKYMDAAIAADPESAEAKEMQNRGRKMLQDMISAQEQR